MADGRKDPARSNARGEVRWTKAVADEVLARTAEGWSLRQVADDPAMPSLPTISRRVREDAAFCEAMQGARMAAGRRGIGSGPSSRFCPETAEVIFERVCAGQGLVRVCEDPALPAESTVYRWARTRPAFREALRLAKEIQGDRIAEQGWDWCREMTPETAQMRRVQLSHVRWHAGRLSPRVYGADREARMEEALAAARAQMLKADRHLIVRVKDFRRKVGPDGARDVAAYIRDLNTGEMVPVGEDTPCDWGDPDGEREA